MRRLFLLLAIVLFTGLAGPSISPTLGTIDAYAVEPDEMLADPALEARARAISAGLRCLVCQNESIDDSSADLAKDIRLLVRKRVEAGDTNGEVVDYLVSRYGEFVLLKPRLEWKTIALWGCPAVLLLAGAGFAFLRARRPPAMPGPRLTGEEEAAIEKLLEKQG